MFSGNVQISPEIKHSEAEERFLAIGKSITNRYIFVVFTLREKEEETSIRPISARYMRDKEVKKYEENLT